MRLATRGSQLARIQTDLAAAALAAHGVDDVEVVVIETTGDRKQSTPVTALPGQGWFTGEVENALRDGRADSGVHSAKDLPSELAAGLVVAAYLERADVRDGLVSSSGTTLAELPRGSRVGTSSPRREALIKAINPDVDVVPVRGNVDTRLRKVESGELDALLIACAGLDRMGLGDRLSERLDPTIFVPAPAQGAIALETAVDSPARDLVAQADHEATRCAIAAERAALVALGGGCLLPLGAWARFESGELVLTAALAVGERIARVELRGDPAGAVALGHAAAATLSS